MCFSAAAAQVLLIEISCGRLHALIQSAPSAALSPGIASTRPAMTIVGALVSPFRAVSNHELRAIVRSRVLAGLTLLLGDRLVVVGRIELGAISAPRSLLEHPVDFAQPFRRDT